MPAPEFTWSEHPVPALAVDGVSGAAVPVSVPLPDLRAWASPLDKAEILLESAAEVEHALMVQYLYAAWSLKGPEEDPGHARVLDDGRAGSWPRVLLGLACEEMGHLMTVQDLLVLLGLPVNLEREDFPPRKDLYPFALHLQPLQRTSLARYVVAEAPADAPGIEDVVAVAQGSGGPRVNRVGVLYALLGVVFATPEQVQAGAGSGDPWDATVARIAEAAYTQAPPEAWHLLDEAFLAGAEEQQATPSDWEVGGVRVHRVADRDAAREAVRDIGEQGEGPTSSGERSHFERLLQVYRGRGRDPAFPDGEWTPTRDVPTDPRPADLADPRTRRWAELTDLRYGLLLGLVEHCLVASGDDRLLLVGWAFAEMRSRLAVLGRRLTTMRSGGPRGGVAAAPFSLPVPVHLPGAEPARWQLHGRRLQSAVDMVEALQADGADDPWLQALADSDRQRLVLIAARTTPPAATTSFARDIGPLFRPVDVEHMRPSGVDLGSYEGVRDAAEVVLQRLRGDDGAVMPPPPHRPWTTAQMDLFARWIEEGHPA
ncbi:ferritin-like protein [Geodermatophilus sp. YIM 151500]|uniref:ferritin-like protein n=1 Tax=Geodermatophilus sp. YIM 151500 TaxID=2984531 RepID=UPI0021E3A2E5|nr:ferritin-like protein [Geodermatophilus sp. YIM 151500]MCV2489178.1 ferritin-like protein [Geodermatophilus sp. YIM 151500]